MSSKDETAITCNTIFETNVNTRKKLIAHFEKQARTNYYPGFF